MCSSLLVALLLMVFDDVMTVRSLEFAFVT